jgi:organic radical activating enzyme
MYDNGNLREALMDQYSKYLGVSVIPTYRCNFKCKTCCETLTNDPTRVDQVLKLEDLEAFIKFLIKVNETLSDDESKFNWILFTGGEVTTLPFEYIIEACKLTHEYGFRASMATNGSKGAELLKLDGILDRMVISHHWKEIVGPDWVSDFKTTKILLSKLLDQKNFSTREKFEKAVEEIINCPKPLNYRLKFITYGSYTKGFDDVHPSWVDNDFPETAEYFTTPARKANYRGIEVRFTHFNPTENDINGKVAENAHTWIMHPNGNVNRHWGSDEFELDYKTSTDYPIIKSAMREMSEKFAKNQSEKYGLDPTKVHVIY